MRFPFSFVLPISAAITTLFVLLIVLARLGLASSGEEIAYEDQSNGNWEISVLDLQTGVEHKLTASSSDELTPAWSPDGQQIAFISETSNHMQSGLYLMNADGSNPHQISSASDIYRDPIWSPDGQSVVLMHGYAQIVLVDTHNSAEHWLGVGFAPRISPDGRQVLYYDSAPNNSPSDHLYVLNLATHIANDLTPGPDHDWDGKWSPDGRHIAFTSTRNGKAAIYTMNADGSEQRAITGSDNDVTPAWSPDGRQIVYAGGDSSAMQLYIMNADGTGARQITFSDGNKHAPAWRPQSR